MYKKLFIFIHFLQTRPEEGKQKCRQRECISLHIGQAGIQLGNVLWDLFCLEHGITKDGSLKKHTDEGYATFFSATESEKQVPRAIMVDLEPTVLGENSFPK